ncbi:MAG: ABC transporter ATP-binding protein [Candidatus Lokiarchaeota archaeon]|nr:ABC transporter ATP-binding protein [Candidatus Lokiarchaeota archaeon]
MNTEAIIQFNNVSKKYKDVQALQEVSFSIDEGDIFGYIGPNGAGKTTSIKVMVGLIKDYKGEVLIKGKNISKSESEIHKLIGFLPQEVGFQEWRTINHALITFGLLSNIPRTQLKERIQEVLELVGLPELQNKKITHLSGGMKQKLRLAQAILHDPEILILDEPLTGLDPTSRFQMKNIIKKLGARGKTILFSSHILSDVQDIASHIGILNRGKLLNYGTPKQLQDVFRVGNDIEIKIDNDSEKLLELRKVTNVISLSKINSEKYLIKLAPNADIDDTIQEILQFLLKEKVKIRNFNFLTPSLEEVYLKYVQEEET